MGTCDVCNASTSWEEGTAYTADEFKQLVSRGFEPDQSVISLMMAMAGMSRQQTVAQWKQGLVAQSTTGWLLCPSCAARAAKYMPKPSGTGPAGHKLTEPLTPEMLRPVSTSQKAENVEIARAEESETTESTVPAPSQARTTSPKKKWWQFWK